MAGRASKRFKPARKTTVGFLGPEIHFVGDLVDLSETGVLVRASQTVEPGTLGRLGIEVGAETFRAFGVVRRNVPGVGVAFQFTRMTPHNRDLLHRLLLRIGKDFSS